MLENEDWSIPQFGDEEDIGINQLGQMNPAHPSPDCDFVSIEGGGKLGATRKSGVKFLGMAIYFNKLLPKFSISY